MPASGGCSGGGHSPRDMVSAGEDSGHKYLGTLGSVTCCGFLNKQVARVSCQGSVRQCHGCGVKEPQGRHQGMPGSGRGGPLSVLGRTACTISVGSTHSKDRELAGRFSQSPAANTRVVFPASQDFICNFPAMENH